LVPLICIPELSLVKAVQYTLQKKERNSKAAPLSEIKVVDNGDGIPEKNMKKIFQPFFTTKPTGRGTGLGLSLSYDIIVAHGGQIDVHSKEGEGTEFIIRFG